MKKFSFIIAMGAGLFSMVLFQNCGDFEGQGDLSTASDRSIASTASGTSIASTDEDANAVAIGMYRRLSGVTLPIDHPIILQMQNLLLERDFRGAAEIAITPPEPGAPNNFLNITVKDFASKMATEEQEINHPDGINDFIATVIGAVRDDIPAAELLTGSFFYRGNGNGIPNNMRNDIVTSNANYDALNERVDISSQDVLVREDQQMYLSQNSGVQALPDTAGLMTTRGWMHEHAEAGTNRRLIEFGFKIFLCKPIEEWAGLRSTQYVGRDVPRLSVPASGGVANTDEFQSTCSSCHSGMDAYRPAVAYFDFLEDDDDGNFIAYRYEDDNGFDPDPTNDNRETARIPASEQLVPYKFRRGTEANIPQGGTIDDVEGFAVENDNWVSVATDLPYGFQIDSGTGINDFGRMLASSKQYSRCMVQRVFSTICRQELDDKDPGQDFEIERLAEKFEDDGQLLKELFVDVAIHPSCMGVGG